MGDNAIRTSVRLDDGRRVHVRPIGGADTSALRAMHLRLSTLSVQRRFFALLRELPLDQAERFTHVDGLDRAALVAEAGDGSIVGVARYDRASGTATAELAIVVEDAYQHHGLGTSLLEALGSLRAAARHRPLHRRRPGRQPADVPHAWTTPGSAFRRASWTTAWTIWC